MSNLLIQAYFLRVVGLFIFVSLAQIVRPHMSQCPVDGAADLQLLESSLEHAVGLGDVIQGLSVEKSGQPDLSIVL